MAWQEAGKERMRRFKAYQELEARLVQLESELADVRAAAQSELAHKDATIRTLARELASYADRFTAEPIEASESALDIHDARGQETPQKPAEPKPGPAKAMPQKTESGTQPAVRPSRIPLSRLYGEK